MKNSSMLRRLVRGFFTLAIPLWLMVGSIRVVMTPLWLNFEYTRAGFPADPYGFTTEDRLNYGGYGIAYLLNGEDIRFLANLRLPREQCVEGFIEGETCPMFNAAALRHMEDVKIVTQAAYGITLVTFFIGMGMGMMLRRQLPLLYRGIVQGSGFTLVIIVGIVVIAVGAWDTFFDLFHMLFFQAGTWQFYYSDTLIRLYPEQFWFDSALIVGSLTVLGALLVGGGAFWRLKQTPAQI